MPTNDFVPFCNENTGTNLPTQSAYLANPALPIGNQPGIASSNLNNKAIRQASTIAAVISQYVSDTQSVDMLDNQNTADHAIPTALKAATSGAFKRILPTITAYAAAASGNHRATIIFQLSSASATAAATYSDGTSTFTVTSTIAAGSALVMTCTSGAYPVATSGTLTKTAGTGDATILFYSYRAPLYMKVTVLGGGGAGGGGTAGAGSSCGGGGGAGGVAIAYITSPAATYAYVVGGGGAGNSGAGGNAGTSSSFNATIIGAGGNGGSSGGASTTIGIPAATAGSGGTGSGGTINLVGSPGMIGIKQDTTNVASGSGGPSMLGGAALGRTNSTGTGTAGTTGSGGSGGAAISGGGASTGGAGGAGVIIVEEFYQ